MEILDHRGGIGFDETQGPMGEVVPQTTLTAEAVTQTPTAEAKPQKSLMDMAKESREKRWEETRKEKEAARARRKEKWENFVKGVKAFGTRTAEGAKSGWETVANVVEMGRNKDIRAEIVDRVRIKADSAWENAKNGMREVGREMGDRFDALCDTTSEAINRGIDVIEQKSIEAAKVAGASVIEWVAVPTMKAMEGADKLVSNVEISMKEGIAGYKESRAEKLLSKAKSPNSLLLVQVVEVVKKGTEKKNLLNKLARGIEGWLENRRFESVMYSIDANTLRAEADEIRKWYEDNQRPSESLKATAQNLRTI